MDVLWCSLFFCKRWFGQTLKISQITLDSLSQRLWWLLARQPAVQSWAWPELVWDGQRKEGMILSAGKVQNNWTFWEMHGNAKSPSHKLQQTMFWDCQVHLLVGFNYFRIHFGCSTWLGEKRCTSLEVHSGEKGIQAWEVGSWAMIEESWVHILFSMQRPGMVNRIE